MVSSRASPKTFRRPPHPRLQRLVVKLFLFQLVSSLLSCDAFFFRRSTKPSPSPTPHVLEVRPSNSASNEPAKFGQAICMSADGNRFLVGSNGNNRFQGALYDYRKVDDTDGSAYGHWKETKIVHSSATKAEEKKPGELRMLHRGSGFGFSCAMNAAGNFFVTGAPGNDFQRGAAYVYYADDATAGWIAGTSLDPPEPLRTGDSFGWGVGVCGKGHLVAVSAKGRNANDGVVFTYTCDKSSKCKYTQTLSPPDKTDMQGPRGIRIRNNFGVSMSLSIAGNVLIVGSTGYMKEQGAVYIFTNPNNEWVFHSRLTSMAPQNFGFFGYKVSLSGDGEWIVVGADGEEDYTGSAQTFRRSSDGKSWIAHELLKRAERRKNDNFGGAVSLSPDGKTLLVAAPGVSRDSLPDVGTVHVYKRNDKHAWESIQEIKRGIKTATANDFFGWGIACDRIAHRVAISSPQSNNELGLVVLTTVNEVAEGAGAEEEEEL